MKKSTIGRILFLAFALVLSISSIQAKDGKNFLWEVKSETNTLYIVGSVHIAKKSIYPLPKVFYDAYDSCDAVAVEIDITKAEDMEIAMRIIQKAVYQDDETLEQNVSPELFEKIETIFKELGIPKDKYNKLKPWYAIMIMSMMDAQNKGYEKVEGIDMHFVNRATEDGKALFELESIEEQLKLFDYLDKVMNVYVEYSLNTLESSTDKIDQLFEYWNAGDTEKLFEFTINELKSLDNFEEFLDVFFWKRNKSMAEVIDGYMQSNMRCFVIVGAGHLLTEKGIIGLLQAKKKYTIRQL